MTDNESTIHAMSREHALASLASAPACAECRQTLTLEKRLVGQDPATSRQVFDYVGQCPAITVRRNQGMNTTDPHTLRVLGTARD